MEYVNPFLCFFGILLFFCPRAVPPVFGGGIFRDSGEHARFYRIPRGSAGFCEIRRAIFPYNSGALL